MGFFLMYTNILVTALNPEHLEDQEVNDVQWYAQRNWWPSKHQHCFLVSMKFKFIFHYSNNNLYYMCKKYMDWFLLSMHHFLIIFSINFNPGSSTCEMSWYSEVLAIGCFNVMTAQLQFNIHKLESSLVFNDDVLDLQDRIKKFISPTLSLYWGKHLQQGNFTDTVNFPMQFSAQKEGLGYFWKSRHSLITIPFFLKSLSRWSRLGLGEVGCVTPGVNCPTPHLTHVMCWQSPSFHIW